MPGDLVPLLFVTGQGGLGRPRFLSLKSANILVKTRLFRKALLSPPFLPPSLLPSFGVKLITKLLSPFLKEG